MLWAIDTNIMLFALHQQWPWFVPLVLVIMGASVGSFIGCMTYRMPQKITLFRPPSRCNSCGHRLGVKDLTPIFSWILLKGKCRYCGIKIGPQVVILEIITALQGAVIYLCLGPRLSSLAYVLAAWFITFFVLLIANFIRSKQ